MAMCAARWSLRAVFAVGLLAVLTRAVPSDLWRALVAVCRPPREVVLCVRQIYHDIDPAPADDAYQSPRRTRWILSDGAHDVAVHDARLMDQIRERKTYRLLCSGSIAETMSDLVAVIGEEPDSPPGTSLSSRR